MFHFLRWCKKVLKRFSVRILSLLIYIYENKIILISLLYVFFDLLFLNILPEVRVTFPMGETWIILGLAIVFSFLLLLLRNIAEKYFSQKPEKKGSRECLFFLSMLPCLLLTISFSLLRVNTLLLQDEKISDASPSFTNKVVVFEGTFTSEKQIKHTNALYEITTLEGSGFEKDLTSKILVKVKRYGNFKIGEVCNFRGTILEPENFEDFDYKEYLKNKGVYFILEYPEIVCDGSRKGFFLRNILSDFKQKVIAIGEKNLKEPQLSLFLGILMGEKRIFSESFEKGIRVCGVSHIVAASGYNITIIIILVQSVLKFLPLKYRLVVTMFFIWSFCLLAGLSPSIVRACIMASISLLALYFGRQNSIHISLALTCAIFIFFTPRIVFDIGFQLSLFATLGLVYLSPIVANLFLFIFKKTISLFEEFLIPTLSCTLVTLPVVIGTFKTLTIWSVFANVLVLPVVEATMSTGLLALLSIYVNTFLSRFFFLIVNIQLKYIEIVINLINGIGWGYWELESVVSVVPIALAIILVMICIYFYPIKEESSNYYVKLFS